MPTQPCPNCGRENRESASFCDKCGTRLQTRCPNCDADLRPTAKFCDKCGTRIAGGETTPTSASDATGPDAKEKNTPLALVSTDEVQTPSDVAAAKTSAEVESNGEAAPTPPEDSTSTTSVMPASFGDGRYVVERLVGEGGKKKVYLAEDTRLGRPVAVAVIKNEGMSDHDMARIRREAQAMAWLGDHPNVVTIHDIGEENGQTFIVGQYMEGGDVDTLLERSEGNRLPIRDAVTVTREIAQALEHAHEKGIVHRDIKPGNVWLTADGTPKLGDFGLAMVADRSRITRAGTMLGTVHYMPPETALGGGRDADARSDIYSLGCMFYELLTGDTPFTGSMSTILNAHVNTQPVPPSRKRPEIPASIDRLVLHMLAKSPRERPSSARQVIQALRQIENELPAEASTLTSVEAGIAPTPEPAPPTATPPTPGTEDETSKVTPPEEPLPQGVGVVSHPQPAPSIPAAASATGAEADAEQKPEPPTPPQPPVPKQVPGLVPAETPVTRSQLVERETHMADLEWVVGEAMAGRGRTVMIEGAAGSGKTRLAEEVLSRAQAKGAATYRLTSGSHPSQEPLRPWEPLVETLAEQFGASKVATDMGASLPVFARAFPGTSEVLSDSLPQTEKAASSEQARAEMLSGIVRMVRRDAASRPAVILVENAENMDETSAILLRKIADACGDTKLLVIVTRELGVSRMDKESSEPHRSALEILDELAGDDRTKLVQLDPLSEYGTLLLATSIMEQAPNSAVATALHRNGGGSPLFTVMSSLALLAEKSLEEERPIEEWAAFVPRDLAEAVDRLLGTMPENTVRDLQAGAFFGDVFDIEAVASMSGSSDSEVRGSLQQPVLLGLLRRGHRPETFEYASPTVSRRVRERVPRDRASQLHLAAARIKDERSTRGESAGPGSAEAALQYELSEMGEAGSRSVELLGLAADWAMKRMGFSESLSLATRALDVAERAGSSEDSLIPLKLRKARAAMAAGEHAEAQKAYLEAADAARRASDVSTMAEAVLGYGDSLPTLGIGDENLTEFLEATLGLLASSDSEPDRRHQAIVTGRLALQYATRAAAAAKISGGIGQSARELAETAYEIGEETGARRAVAYSLLSRYFSDLPSGELGELEEVLGSAIEIVWLGEEIGDAAIADVGRLLRITTQLEGGRVSAAIAETELKGESEAACGRSLSFWQSSLLRAMQAILEGRYKDAESLADRSRAFGLANGLASAEAAYTIQMLAIRRAEDRLGEVRPLVESISADATDRIFWEVMRAYLLSRTGDGGEARMIVDRLTEGDLGAIPRDLNWKSVLWGLAESCIHLRHTSAAAPLYETLLPYADRYMAVGNGALLAGSTSRYLGGLAALMGRIDEASVHFEKGIEMDARLKAVELEALGRTALGETLLERDAPGDRERALSHLSEAVVTFQKLGIDKEMDRALNAKLAAQGVQQPPL